MSKKVLIDLNPVIQHPGTKLTFPFECEIETDDKSGFAIKEIAAGEIHAQSLNNALLISGRAQAICILDCARCAKELEMNVLIEIDEEFGVEGVPASYGTGQHAYVIDEQPYPLFKENSLSIADLLYQEFVVQMPAKPLCDEACEPSEVNIEAYNN